MIPRFANSGSRQEIVQMQTVKFKRFIELLETYTPNEGANLMTNAKFGAVRYSAVDERCPAVDQAFILVVGQGRKSCHIGNQEIDFVPGKCYILFWPMPVEVQIVEASPEKPFLAAGFHLDLARLSDLIQEIDVLEPATSYPDAQQFIIASGMLGDNLLDAVVRFMEALSNPQDSAILGKRILEEIYYHLLNNGAAEGLRSLLAKQGDIQKIARAVNHIHQHISQAVPVEVLADLAGMSRTIFFQRFKALTHMSPLQYVKSIKLHAAQRLLKEGRNVSEAAYMTGYNSATQFSREYKRLFGVAPSKTLK